MTTVPSDPVAQRRKPAEEVFALPSATGGLAGAAVHQLSLGSGSSASQFPKKRRLTVPPPRSNVYRLASLLRSPSSPYAKRAPSLKQITIIGVGGAHDAASVERFRQAGADAVVRAAPLSSALPEHDSVRLIDDVSTAQACATALGREGVSVFEQMAGGAVQAKL